MMHSCVRRTRFGLPAQKCMATGGFDGLCVSVIVSDSLAHPPQTVLVVGLAATD